MFLLIFRYVFGGAIEIGGGCRTSISSSPGSSTTGVLFAGIGCGGRCRRGPRAGVRLPTTRAFPIPRAAVLVGRSLLAASADRAQSTCAGSASTTRRDRGRARRSRGRGGVAASAGRRAVARPVPDRLGDAGHRSRRDLARRDRRPDRRLPRRAMGRSALLGRVPERRRISAPTRRAPARRRPRSSAYFSGRKTTRPPRARRICVSTASRRTSRCAPTTSAPGTSTSAT